MKIFMSVILLKFNNNDDQDAHVLINDILKDVSSNKLINVIFKQLGINR